MLQKIANIISIIAGIITILGIGGIVTWSISKKGKTQWSDTVLSVFGYGIKTAFCIIFGVIILWIYLLITTIITTVISQGPANEAVWWESAKFYFNLATYLVLAVFAVPLLLVLCSCIYKSSWEPWQRFYEKLFKKTKLEVIEARYYSVKNHSKFIDVTEAIKNMVHKGTRKVLVNNDIAGDPERGAGKELTVKYRLDGDERTKTANERSTMSLD